MFHCKMVNLFYALIPLSGWRSFLIRRHIEGCARCQAGLASLTESQSLLVQEGTGSVGRDFWTAIQSGLTEKTPERTEAAGVRAPAGLRPRRWAFAAALLLVLATGYWVFKDFQPGVVSAPAAAAAPERFELAHVRVGGVPADIVIYHPQGSDMIIVWAGKNE